MKARIAMSHDRPLAVCYTGQREINRGLVENGYVFLYARGSNDEAERDEAQAAGRGIWLLKEVEHYRRSRAFRKKGREHRTPS